MCLFNVCSMPQILCRICTACWSVLLFEFILFLSEFIFLYAIVSNIANYLYNSYMGIQETEKKEKKKKSKFD